MKLTSHSIYWVDENESPSVSATFTFDKGTSLDLVVKHLEACGQGPSADVETLTTQNGHLNDNCNILKESLKNANALYRELASECDKLRKDVADKSAALQEIQGTYTKLASEVRQVRSDYEKVVTELDAARLENVALKRQVDELKLAQTGNTPVVDMRGSKFEITQRFAEGFNPDLVANALREDLTFAASNGPVGEDPKTGEYVYEQAAVEHDPVDIPEPEEVEPAKTPKDLFREAFSKECADIRGTTQSEVLDQAYAVFTARRSEAASYGLQRELGVALTLAIASCLNMETDVANALFSVKLDAIKGKAAEAKAAESKPDESALLTKFRAAMDSAPVKTKNSPRQKIVAALILTCAENGKVQLNSLKEAATALSTLALSPSDWSAVLDKGSNGKSQLEILYRIVATSLEVGVT